MMSYYSHLYYHFLCHYHLSLKLEFLGFWSVTSILKHILSFFLFHVWISYFDVNPRFFWWFKFFLSIAFEILRNCPIKQRSLNVKQRSMNSWEEPASSDFFFFLGMYRLLKLASIVLGTIFWCRWRCVVLLTSAELLQGLGEDCAILGHFLCIVWQRIVQRSQNCLHKCFQNLVGLGK